MRFFFTGFMGSGKSFWAKKLSAHLDIDFIDLDEYIESKEKMTVSQIFETKGEDYFRYFENFCLKEIVSNHDKILIACGGGTPCYHDNKKIMKALGKIIFFDVDINTLTVRLIRKKAQRPLLHHLKDDEIKNYIETKLQERNTCYQDYDIKVEADLINETTFANILKQYV
jgi:shikimate kinase